MDRWLIAHGHETEATAILAALESTTPSDPHVLAERHEIVFSVEYERTNAIRWRDLLRGRTSGGTKTVRRLLLGCGTQAMQQLGGINVTSYYLPTVLVQSVGLDERMARLLATIRQCLLNTLERMPGAELLWLQNESDARRGNGLAHQVRLMTHHHLDGVGGHKTLCSIDHMLQQQLAAYSMQNLGAAAFQPRSLTSGHDDDSECIHAFRVAEGKPGSIVPMWYAMRFCLAR